MIDIRNGDLLDINTDYIAQQVNCRGVMGAGLALQIRKEYPSSYDMYRAICQKYAPEELLGRMFICGHIINVFGQLNYGRNRDIVYTNYSALIAAFQEINRQLPSDKSIAFPYGFGCGLANGKWETVLEIIKECFPDREIIICKKGGD